MLKREKLSGYRPERMRQEMERIRGQPIEPIKRTLSSRIFGVAKTRLEKKGEEQARQRGPEAKTLTDMLLERIGRPPGDSDAELGAYRERVRDLALRAAALGAIGRSEERGSGTGFSVRKALGIDTRRLPDVMSPSSDWRAWLLRAAELKARNANPAFRRFLQEYIEEYVRRHMARTWDTNIARARQEGERGILNMATGILFHVNDRIRADMYSDWQREEIHGMRRMDAKTRAAFEKFMRKLGKR